MVTWNLIVKCLSPYEAKIEFEKFAPITYTISSLKLLLKSGLGNLEPRNYTS